MEIGYLAGLFDGEGCIHIPKVPLKSAAGFSYSLRVIFGMTHEPVIRAIAEQTGSAFCALRARKNPEASHWKVAYQTQLCGENAAQLLRDMLPFLIVKREEAILAIKLQDHITRYRNSAKRWTFEDRQSYEDYREGLRLQIKSLKRTVGAPDGMMANSEKLLCPASNGADGQPRAKQAQFKIVGGK